MDQADQFGKCEAKDGTYLIHYNVVIMGMMASQITSLMVAYSTVNSGADQGKIKAPRH